MTFKLTTSISCEGECDDDIEVDLVDEHGWQSLRMHSVDGLRQLTVDEAIGDGWIFPNGPLGYALCPDCSETQ